MNAARKLWTAVNANMARMSTRRFLLLAGVAAAGWFAAMSAVFAWLFGRYGGWAVPLVLVVVAACIVGVHVLLRRVRGRS